MARAKIDEIDVTEHIANMFDALVGSMDWGSNFLESETIDSILVIGEMLGFQIPTLSDSYANWKRVGFTDSQPDRVRGCDYNSPEFKQWYDEYQEWSEKRKTALEKWSKQRAAELAEKARGDE